MTWRQVRALPMPVWALLGGTFVNRFGGFVLTFLALALTMRGFSVAQAGIAVGAYGLGSVLASAAGGVLADRWGRKATIAVSMFASAATTLALGRADGLPALVVLAGCVGLAAELYRPAAGALLADLIPEGQRVTGFALYRFAINAGTAVGSVVGGLLATRSFGLIFIGDALTSVVYGCVALVALPVGARAVAATHREGTTHGTARGGFRFGMDLDPRFVAFLVASVLGGFVYVQHLATLGPQMSALGFSPDVYGTLLALNGLIIIVCEIPLTAFSQRLPRHVALAGGQVLIGLGFGAVALAANVPALAFTVFLWTCGEMLFSPIAGAYVADISPADQRGRYQGLYGLTFGLAFVIAPPLGTLLFGVSHAGLWALCAALGLVSAAIIVATRDRAAPAPAAEPALDIAPTAESELAETCDVG